MFNPTEEDRALIEKYRREQLPKYAKPSVTADIVAVRPAFNDIGDGNWRRDPVFGLELLLIQRGLWPYKDCWALPGGFCHEDESVTECAHRELKEETGLESDYLIPVGVFSEKDRDPRSWVISNAFVSVCKRGEGNDVRGGDDAKCARWFKVVNPVMSEGFFDLPFSDGGTVNFRIAGTYEPTEFDGGRVLSVDDTPLAFDHACIIAQAFLRMISFDPLRLALFFLPEEFSLSEYVGVYQYLTRKQIPKGNLPNFRRQLTATINPLLVECGNGLPEGNGRGHRVARKYRRAQG